MTRADIYCLKTQREPAAVLVLCPGLNGNGKTYLSAPQWTAYAERLNLGLAGLSFASDVDDLKTGSGYYYASKGSGKLLLDGIRAYYKKDMPLLLYGFSGGAHFTARFAEWSPERVIAWCACAAGWWDKPSKSSAGFPPGIVACGAEDERLAASQNYFWDGRELGRPWLWIDIKGMGHSSSAELDAFVMSYFELALRTRGGPRHLESGLWVDIYDRTPAPPGYAVSRPCAAAWLPDSGLFDKWVSLTKGGSK
jgi:pimeloyl-ACP methyl ester carboxylesterase